MAFSHGSKARAIFSGVDLSAYLNSVNVQGTGQAADVTALSNTAKAYISGIQDATLTAEGFLDSAASASEQELLAALGGTVQVTHFIAGTAVADRGYGLEGVGTTHQPATDTESAAKLSAEVQSSTGAEPVTVHQSGGSVTGGGTAAVQDNTAASTNGGVGYLQALGCNGGTAAVKVQHSTDNITFVDLITFSDVTSITAPVGERVASAGTVRQYTRATWTVTGGTADFIVAFGRK